MQAAGKKLTARQRELLRFIRDRALEGAPFTFRGAAEALGGVRANAIFEVVEALERRGYVAREACKAGGVRLAGARVRLEYEDTPAGGRLREALEGGA